jgi:glycosyltransferase involved in cell wall biosynthesis
MNVFAFASLTETQGMVLTEAMAAGVPVVALDAPGAREVVRDGKNGRLVPRPEVEAFGDALRWVAVRPPGERRLLAESVAVTAREYSMARSAEKQIALYESLAGDRHTHREIDASLWTSARKLIAKEWEILRNIAHAAGEAVRTETDGKPF